MRVGSGSASPYSRLYPAPQTVTALRRPVLSDLAIRRVVELAFGLIPTPATVVAEAVAATA